MYKIRDYHSTLGVAYDPTDVLTSNAIIMPPSAATKEPRGVCHSIPIAECLIGTTWDAIALAYLSAFNPTSIRVTRGETTCNSSVGRITVYVDADDRICSTHKECMFLVSTTVDVRHGMDFMEKLNKKIDNKE